MLLDFSTAELKSYANPVYAIEQWTETEITYSGLYIYTATKAVTLLYI